MRWACIIKRLKACKGDARKHEQMSIIAKSLRSDDMANVAARFAGLKVTVERPKSGTLDR